MDRRSLLRKVGPFAIGGSVLATGSAAAQEGGSNEVSATDADEIYLDASPTADYMVSVTEELELHLRSLDQNGGSTGTSDGNTSSTKVVDSDPAEEGYLGFSLGAFSESRIYQSEYATAAAWVEWETDIEEPTPFEIHAEYDYITMAGTGDISPFTDGDEEATGKDEEASEWDGEQTTLEDDVDSEFNQIAIPVISGLLSGSSSDAAYLIQARESRPLGRA